MAQEQVEVEVAADPDEVWAKVGDFGAVGDFLSGIESLRLEGDDRIIGMFGLEIRERLLERDEQARSITYSVIEGLPIERHRATITVVPEGKASRVTWSVEVEPDEMAPVFADTYRQALVALQGQFA